MPPILGFDQCENAPIAFFGRAWDSAPLIVSNILICSIALPPEGAGKEGLKKEPSRALIVIGRIAPSVWGSFASQKTLIAKSA